MVRYGYFLTVILLMMAAVGFSRTASAQSAFSDKIKRCAALADDAERLACYDTAVASLDAEAAKLADARKRAADQRAQEAAAKAEAERKRAEEQAAKAKVDAFGAAGLPDERKPKVISDSIDELEATIQDVFSSVQGIVVALDNGQMWRQTDGISLPPVRAGDKVLIKKRAISGFRMTLIRQRRTVDVKRYR